MKLPKNIYFPLNMGRTIKDNSDSIGVGIPNKSISLKEWLDDKGITENQWVVDEEGILVPKSATSFRVQNDVFTFGVSEEGAGIFNSDFTEIFGASNMSGNFLYLIGNTNPFGSATVLVKPSESKVLITGKDELALLSDKLIINDFVNDVITIEGQVITVDGLTVIIKDLPVYADNTAAASLATDTLYKTATGEIRIKV